MRTFLLSLYPRAWRQRYGAEIADLLRQEPLSLRLVIDLIRGALDARLHPELVGPILAAAGGGTVQVPSRGPRIGLFALIVVFLLFLVFGGLYAYRSETPAVPTVPMTQVIDQLQRGQVTKIEFAGDRATVTLADGTREVTTVAGAPSDPLSRVLNEYNATHATGKVAVDYSSDASAVSYLIPALFSFLLTVLPLAVLALLILLLARRLTTDHGEALRASRYEWLARIADLRDRGVLTEEEFQREKARILE